MELREHMGNTELLTHIGGGLILLFAGGEALLRGSVSIAHKLGLSTLLVSMVVVGFGTSAPELLVSLSSAYKGAPNIALGNVVGSNIANILLILGASAAFSPIMCTRFEIRRDSLAVVLASIVLVALSLTGLIGRVSGIAMVAALVAYLAYAFVTDRNRENGFRERIEKDVGKKDVPLGWAVGFCVAGLTALAAGAHYLVEGATTLAEQFGVPNAVIGLTLVAVGTSLPELATAIVSAIRKHADVVIGNVIGSNLFNILGILGVTGAIIPIPFEGRIAEVDVWIMLVVAILLAPVIWTGRVISRFEGLAFVALYVVYIIWVYSVGV